MKKKLLIISLNPTYPLSHGGAIAQYYFLEKLQNIYEITFITIINSEAKKENYEKLKRKLSSINFVAFEYIERKTKLKIYWIDLKIFFYNVFTSILLVKKHEPQIYEPSIDLNFKSFLVDFTKTHKFDLIQFEFFESLPYCEIFSDDVEKIFIHHEIRFKAKFQQSINSLMYLNSLKQYEINALKKFTKIVVFNDEDQMILNSNGLINVRISNYSIPNSLKIKSDISNDFNKFIFLGNQIHYPNFEGLEWFLNSIYVPNYDDLVPIYITGNWEEIFKKKYSRYDKIVFTGFVKSLELFFQNSVLLCPIKSGSGLRTKILEAFANNVPVFSTSMGAEGLIGDSSHLIVFDEINFMKQYNIYFNNIQLHSIAKSAFDFFSYNFNDEKIINQRLKVYSN